MRENLHLLEVKNYFVNNTNIFLALHNSFHSK